MQKTLPKIIGLTMLAVMHFHFLMAQQQRLSWPVRPNDQNHRLFAGYGTYDDYSPAGSAIHLHEGLDILVDSATEVVAVEGGIVVLAEPTKGYANHVFVSRGNNNRNEALCYIHINVANNPAKNRPWKENDTIARGAVIGTVTRLQPILPHLHFDWRRKEPTEPWTFQMNPFDTLASANSYLPEFAGNPIELLTRESNPAANRPQFSGPIHYRSQTGQPGQPDKYYTTKIHSGDTVIAGNVDIVARISETFGPAGPGTLYNIGPRSIKWRIDDYKPGFVAGIPIPDQQQINFTGLFLQAEPGMTYNYRRRKPLPDKTYPLTIPVAMGAGRNTHWKFFKNRHVTETGHDHNAVLGNLVHTIYSNHITSRSVPRHVAGTKPGIYWYMLTNVSTDNTHIESKDDNYYWDTNGMEWEPWNDNDDGKDHEASSNKNAAFPDGRYILTITAYGYGDDQDVNSRKDTVSINNFNETITSCNKTGDAKDTYAKGDEVYIKGEGFPRYRDFRVFVIKNRDWPDGTAIPNDANRVAAVTVTSDADGLIQPTLVWDKYAPNGNPDKGYDIVLDYNWDSLYSTPKLDRTVDVLDEKPLPYSIIGSVMKIEKTKCDVSCHGTCNGTITLSVTGGAVPYVYYWNDLDTATTQAYRDSLCAGTYIVAVVDSNGNTLSDTTIITQPAKLIAHGSGYNPTCGQCNGHVTITATGGTAPYTYSWPNGTLTSLCPGTYTGTVTDANGCKDSCTVTISDTVLTAVVTGTNTSCDSCTGTATITASGGRAPYTYNWPGGTRTQLCAGTYTGTVTDANGCTAAASVTITSTSSLTATASATNTSCDSCNGTATITASGGRAPYTYDWPGGTLTGLCAGTYTGIVTDANGCTAAASVTISTTSTLTATASGTNATCDSCNGSATITAFGGTAPYTYDWPGGTRTGLCAGTYTGTVTDANGCRAAASVTIRNSASTLIAAASGTNATCDSCNGSATITASGGRSPYTYNWPGGTLTGLCAGTYTGTVTDANGCRAAASVTITSISSLTATASGTNATCESCNGTATITASGGRAPYTYSWPNGTLTGLCPGTYTGTVTDSIGCRVTRSVTISSMSTGRLCDTLIRDTLITDTLIIDTAITVFRQSQAEKLNSTPIVINRAYPNPFDDVVNIDFNSTEAGEAYVVVQNVTGKTERQFKVAASKGYNTLRIDGRHLTSGIYFVKIIMRNSTIIKIQRR